MAIRIDPDSVSHGSLCNRENGKTIMTIEFLGGRTVEATLKGNPYRDIAGRILSFRHPSPDPGALAPDSLAAQQHGHTGDITASRKVKIPTIPLSELYRNPKSKDGEFPHTWKNSLYLEWYSQENGRVVLESADFELTLSDPAWRMTAAEETEAREQARRALTRFLDQICDITREREDNRTLFESKEELTEHDHEQNLRFSDRMNDRHGELIDKFGMEDEDTISDLMGWNEIGNADAPPQDGFLQPDWSQPDDDWEAPEDHPLIAQADDLLDRFTPRRDQSEEEQERFFAIAMVSAKLAGALSGWNGESFDDASFTIASLKRVLARIDAAVAVNEGPAVTKLLTLRQKIIDLQQELRGS